MNTKLLLGASAIVMGAAGIAGTFAPQELATALGITSTGVLPLLIQLLSALLFGFAMVNWLARGSLIGGIYNRPVLVGNVAHFTIGGLAAIKAVLTGEHRHRHRGGLRRLRDRIRNAVVPQPRHCEVSASSTLWFAVTSEWMRL